MSGFLARRHSGSAFFLLALLLAVVAAPQHAIQCIVGSPLMVYGLPSEIGQFVIADGLAGTPTTYTGTCLTDSTYLSG